MAKVNYPLKQVLDVKQKRVDDAQKIVEERVAALTKEQQKLAEREAERDKVKTHKMDKLKQLRETLDRDSTSTKIQQMKAYLKVVDEKLASEEKKVEEQKTQVKLAEENLSKAKEELKLRRQELDKLEIHRKQWVKQALLEINQTEEREQDEMSSLIHAHKIKGE